MEMASPQDSKDSETSKVLLWWFPVGAGAPTRVSTISSSSWERIDAWRSGRKPERLVHAALEIYDGDERYIIEMAPEWSQPRLVERGVVARGPVGLPVLGRSRLFRYEVRCRPKARPFDRSVAVSDPVTVSSDRDLADCMLRRIRNVPVFTWGRRVASTDDMWNSNSVISWLLLECGVDVSVLASPAGTRAPGWAAGIAVAERARQSM